MNGASILLGLGTNVGDRAANLAAAIEALNAVGRVGARSRIYESAPMYVTDQPAFLNMCIGFESDLGPMDLLRAVKAIEVQLGRRAGPRNGPRPIDIDILFFGEQVIDLDELKVPHMGMAERAFVLCPLAEIAPARLNPRTGLTVDRMRSGIGHDGVSVPGIRLP